MSLGLYATSQAIVRKVAPTTSAPWFFGNDMMGCELVPAFPATLRPQEWVRVGWLLGSKAAQTFPDFWHSIG
jgi:hypothetical protein